MKSYDTQPGEVASKESTPSFDATEIPENLPSAAEADEHLSDTVIESTRPAFNTPTDLTPAKDDLAEADESTAITNVAGEPTVITTEANEPTAITTEPTVIANRASEPAVITDVTGEPAVIANEAHEPAIIEYPAEEEEDQFPLSNSPAGVVFAPASAGWRWPSREQLLAWAPFWAVILLGTILRFWDLGAKPLHHDESLHGYYSLQLLHNLQNWGWCVGLNNPPIGYSCYQYDPLLHGPFQFHAIALVYQLSQWLGAADMVGLPYFLRDYMGKLGAWLTCFLLAVSPSMVYFSRFARDDIYMACFTLLLVVATGRYVRDRKIGWLVLAAAGFALSYATSEATFLTIAVFGSFLGALIVWEIGSKLPLRALLGDPEAARYLPRTFSPLFVLVYFMILGIVARFFFGLLNTMSTFINNNQAIADRDLLNLESITVRILPWLGILLGLVVFSILALEVYGIVQPGRRGLAKLVDRRQQVLDTILTMPWTHWFFALIVGIAIFLLLFTVVFTNIAGGIGDGIWKGLYYWLEQQHVARGGQPWYYYLLMIPLYEQIGVVFAIVGIVRSLRKPNAFRLFLVYWFLGDFFIYSWAGEKMPWLVVFMTMPMMILAALGLEPSVQACYSFLKERFFSAQARNARAVAANERADRLAQEGLPHPRVGTGQFALGVFGVVMAVLLLLPTLHNMYEVTYVEPADGPHEMMIYVQTTTDINPLITTDGVWPLAWYLRDYPNLCFNYPTACPSWVNNVPVIITGGDDYVPDAKVYNGHEYKMRSWWDEGYKMPACATGQTPSLSCADPSLGTGVGPLLWLSYGDNPPANAKFNLGLAAQRVWNWWWRRVPFGGTDGYYPMALYVQKGLGVNP